MNHLYGRVVDALSAVARRGLEQKPTHIIVGPETDFDLRAMPLDLISFELGTGAGYKFLGLIVAIDRNLPRGEFKLAVEI